MLKLQSKGGTSRDQARFSMAGAVTMPCRFLGSKGTKGKRVTLASRRARSYCDGTGCAQIRLCLGPIAQSIFHTYAEACFEGRQ